MAISLSIFSTITKPEERQDAWFEAIINYLELADQVIVIYGNIQDKKLLETINNPKLEYYYSEWPTNWEWKELPNHLFEGFKRCTGDVIIKTDIDYFFHERDYQQMRNELEELYNKDFEVAGMVKLNIMNKEKGFIKTRTPNIINGKLKNKITFGKATNKETDWCEPLKVSGCCKGTDCLAYLDYPVLTTWVYNYDNFFKTKEIIKRDFWTMCQAHDRAFKTKWGETPEKAWEMWRNMQTGRLARAGEKVDHPKVLEDRINRMSKDQWGHSNWQ